MKFFNYSNWWATNRQNHSYLKSNIFAQFATTLHKCGPTFHFVRIRVIYYCGIHISYPQKIVRSHFFLAVFYDFYRFFLHLSAYRKILRFFSKRCFFSSLMARICWFFVEIIKTWKHHFRWTTRPHGSNRPYSWKASNSPLFLYQHIYVHSRVKTTKTRG